MKLECTRCGTVLREEDNKCRKCGTRKTTIIRETQINLTKLHSKGKQIERQAKKGKWKRQTFEVRMTFLEWLDELAEELPPQSDLGPYSKRETANQKEALDFALRSFFDSRGRVLKDE